MAYSKVSGRGGKKSPAGKDRNVKGANPAKVSFGDGRRPTADNDFVFLGHDNTRSLGKKQRNGSFKKDPAELVL